MRLDGASVCVLKKDVYHHEIIHAEASSLPRHMRPHEM